jgi:addiction module RelB/DinJ family antitoxin
MYLRIDPQVKATVTQIYARYGMSLTEAINIFLYQSRNTGGLPFDLRPTKDERKMVDASSAMGTLSQYANPDLAVMEKDAWERAVAEKNDSF